MCITLVQYLYIGLIQQYIHVKDTFVQRYLQHQRSTLQVQYRKRGTIDKLISYRAQLEVGKKFKDIIHHLCVDYWQAESHF